MTDLYNDFFQTEISTLIRKGIILVLSSSFRGTSGVKDSKAPICFSLTQSFRKHRLLTEDETKGK